MPCWNTILDVRQLYPVKPHKNWCHCTCPPAYRTQIRANLGELATYAKPLARNIGVIYDQDLCFEPHVKKDVQSCFYHLRNIAKVISAPDLEKLIHDFISSSLDFCSSLYTCLSQINPPPTVGSKCCSLAFNAVQEIWPYHPCSLTALAGYCISI